MLIKFESCSKVHSVNVSDDNNKIIESIVDILSKHEVVTFIVTDSDEYLISLFNELGIDYRVEGDEVKISKEEAEKLERELEDLKNPIDRISNLIGKKAVKEIFSKPADEVYSELICSIEKKINEVKSFTDGEDNEASEIIDGLKNEIEDKTKSIKKKHSKIKDIKLVIGRAIRMILGAILGILKFSLQVLGCTGLVLCRTAVTFCNEIKSAYSNIYNEYRKEKVIKNHVEEDTKEDVKGNSENANSK